MPADLAALVEDVAAETAALQAILDPLPDAELAARRPPHPAGPSPTR